MPLCKILLIEDNVVNAKLIQALLSKSSESALAEGLSFQLDCCETLAEGIQKLAENSYDVILLDLVLSDSQGIDTLLKVKEKVTDIPIIIQTASEDEHIVAKAFQVGADGYLRKNNLDTNLLIYAIRLAIETRQYQFNVKELQKQQEQELEFKNLESLANSVKTSVTARMFASFPLKESVPDVFAELVQKYTELLELALEERAFKVDYEVSEQLRALAEKLGFFKASPRDVVDIHTQALKEKHQDNNLTKIQAYVDEGRLRLLELMGYLSSYYRKYYIGLSNLNIFPNK